MEYTAFLTVFIMSGVCPFIPFGRQFSADTVPESFLIKKSTKNHPKKEKKEYNHSKLPCQAYRHHHESKGVYFEPPADAQKMRLEDAAFAASFSRVQRRSAELLQ